MLVYRSSFWKSHTLEDLDSLEDLFTIIVMLFYRNSSLTGTNNSRQQPTKAYERLTRLMWRKLSGQDHYHVPVPSFSATSLSPTPLLYNRVRLAVRLANGVQLLRIKFDWQFDHH